MPNYLVMDCPQARAFFSQLGRNPCPLAPYLLISLSEEEVAQAKAWGLEIWDDLSGEKV